MAHALPGPLGVSVTRPSVSEFADHEEWQREARESESRLRGDRMSGDRHIDGLKITPLVVIVFGALYTILVGLMAWNLTETISTGKQTAIQGGTLNYVQQQQGDMRNELRDVRRDLSATQADVNEIKFKQAEVVRRNP